MSRQIVIELGKLLRRTEPCSLYMFNTRLVKIEPLISLIQAIVDQANSLENRSIFPELINDRSEIQNVNEGCLR